MPKQTADSRIKAVAAILKKSGLVDDLKDSEVTTLAGFAAEKHYEKGTTIIHEDAKSRDLYLLGSGTIGVKINMPGAGAGEREEAVYGMHAGDVFGELSLVDGSPRSASVTAEEDVTTYLFDYYDVLALMEQHPTIGYRLMRNIAAIIANRVRNTNMMWRNAILW